MITVGECPCGRVGTLRDGRCAACRVDAGLGQPTPRLSVADLMARLVAELEADEVLDPLAQRFTLAGIWSDLARLAGETLPPVAATVLGDTLDTTIVPLPIPMRGGYADYVREALPAD